jgi:predicted Zn finger-like uncharacterized protein
MKFYCDSCGAKYLIGDEKVRGKVLRIRCKKCDHIMVVKEPSRPTSAEHRSVGDLARRLRNTGSHSAVGPGAPPPPQVAGVPWFYSVGGQTYGPLSLADLSGRFAGGNLGDEAYVWNETFDAWKPGKDVSELQQYFAAGQVRRPHNPTIALSALDVASAPEHSARNGAAAAAPAATQSSSSQDLPAILKRASRTRGDARGQSAMSRPPVAQAPQPVVAKPAPAPDLARPALGKRGKVATEDRLRALRERLKGGSNLGSTGSLRERLKGVKKPTDTAAPAVSVPASAPALESPTAAPPIPAASATRPPAGHDELTVKGELPAGLLESLTPGPEEVTVVAVSELVGAGDGAPAPPAESAAEPEAAAATDDLTVRDVVAEARARASAAPPESMTVRDVLAEARAEASVEAEGQTAEAAADPPQLEDPFFSSLNEPKSLEIQLASVDVDSAVSAPETPAPPPVAPAPQVAPAPEPPAASADEANPAPTMGALFPEQTGSAIPDGALRPISAAAQKAVGQDDEHSPSLLIQLDSVRKGKRRAQLITGIVGLTVLFFAVAAGVVIFVVLDDDSQKRALAEQVEEGRRKAEAAKVKGADVDNLKTYTKDELAELVVNLGEEEVAPEGAEPDAGVAEADAGTPTKRRDPRKAKAPKDNRSALDKALASSGKVGERPPGGAADKARPKVADTGERAKVDVGAGGTHLPSVRSGGKLLAGAGGTNIEGRKKDDADKAAPAQLPSSLTRADLQLGFKHIRRSAGQCLERNMKVSGPLPKSKVKVTVTIAGSGSVQNVGMDAVVKNTPFAACMNAHRSRWKFPSFAGRSMQVSKIFVLQ